MMHVGQDSEANKKMISTEAWVLHRGEQGAGHPAKLARETFTFPDINHDEVLARPIFGCWEGNMGHAIQRSPIDICAHRNEDAVVIGNAGVVQIERIGKAVTNVREGDHCIVFSNGEPDEFGYPQTIFGYDAPKTIGVLAKKTKLTQHQVIRIPENTRFSLEQWAAFSLRYITAWANWRVARGCWQTQMPDVPPADVHVWAWGGGTAYAEILLAKQMGYQVVMLTSAQDRITHLRDLGVDAIDRSQFGEKTFEKDLLEVVHERTRGRGVSIFIDNIGAHYRSTLKALGRQGVITTTGWKRAMTYPTVRAAECIARHLHVFTHYARYSEGLDAVAFAERHGWLPSLEGKVYSYEEIPFLGDEYVAGRVASYFPIFSINAT